ncbi:hypothetical protein [Pseudonocardia endophytica]|uniref:Uncharacterized protein n=1 Tax=Pseudonocardia endophytica TaxID=401976 RepID=A0A4V2PJ00_PSEEN|nr:hypothetical protein [Pseudonocardia endophytica]TCK26596.1 hypothetical protein EV378_2434 [Pseudonocardia endophytica]
MTAVFVAMVLSAGVGVGVASSLAAYAQRNWTKPAEVQAQEA